MQICDNLSVSAAPSQHPYPFCPFGTFLPERGAKGFARPEVRQKESTPLYYPSFLKGS